MYSTGSKLKSTALTPGSLALSGCAPPYFVPPAVLAHFPSSLLFGACKLFALAVQDGIIGELSTMLPSLLSFFMITSIPSSEMMPGFLRLSNSFLEASSLMLTVLPAMTKASPNSSRALLNAGSLSFTSEMPSCWNAYEICFPEPRLPKWSTWVISQYSLGLPSASR